MGKDDDGFLNPFDHPQKRVNSSTHIAYSLAAWTSVAPNRPTRCLLLDLLGGQPLEVAVIELEKFISEDDVSAPTQYNCGRLNCSRKRTREDSGPMQIIWGHSFKISPCPERLFATQVIELQIGPASVPACEAPVGGTVTEEE